MLDSFGFNIIDIFDIILVGLLLYYAYRLVRGTAAINIFIGFVILYLIWKITSALKMDLLSSILGGFMSVGAFALWLAAEGSLGEAWKIELDLSLIHI